VWVKPGSAPAVNFI